MAAVHAWMDAGQLVRAADIRARPWARRPEARAFSEVMVAPWVLVQRVQPV